MFLIFPTFVYSSDIVINEFLPDLPSEIDETIEEWVELYNTSSSTVDLNGYVLKDAYDSHQLIIENITINPSGFIVIKRNKSKFSLNNSSDEVRLFTSTYSATLIDSFSYDKVYENKSWGRIPDGTGSFTNKLEPTPGDYNQAPTPTPTPSQTTNPNTTNSDLSTSQDEADDDEQEINDSNHEDNQEEYVGVVAGYKTTENKELKNLEIKPTNQATDSASVSAFPISFKEEATQSGETKNPPNIPIIAGSGLVVSGIVAIILKKYNTISVIKSWKKKKS